MAEMTTNVSGIHASQFKPEDLASILTNGKMGGHLSAAWALSERGAAIVDPLVQVMKNPDRNVRWSAAIALQRIGSSAVDPLTKVLANGAPETRAPAIWALEQIGDERAGDPLICVLKGDADEFCRWMAAAALRKIGHPDGIAAVNEALKGANAEEIGYIEELIEGS
ncbi:MAG: HEAT repeat domain-containing protein [Methanobacteriota archaeon]|nr:MAG: HEAT repeat domain-containing protein [Euryarchaeota archaeon]